MQGLVLQMTSQEDFAWNYKCWIYGVATGDSAIGQITGTSLTASGSGTAINISGFDIGAISSINTSSETGTFKT